VGRTLEALLPQLGEDDEVIVVDNASRDGTVPEVEAAAPGARVLRMDENLGFAAACNRAAAVATAPLLLFLNPDARPRPGALDALRRPADEQPGWGAWQALVELPDGGVNSSGGVVHLLGFAWAGVAAPPPGPAEVGFASGAALVVRTSLWRALGGFDEAFFMYCEDVDLSWRARAAGFSVRVAPAALAHHYTADRPVSETRERSVRKSGVLLAAKYGHAEFMRARLSEYEALGGAPFPVPAVERPERALARVADFEHFLDFSKGRW
jgi:hypothetical protein